MSPISDTTSGSLSTAVIADMAKTPKNEETKDERSAKETERIAAKTLRNLLNTPPKPFTPKGKSKDINRGKR